MYSAKGTSFTFSFLVGLPLLFEAAALLLGFACFSLNFFNFSAFFRSFSTRKLGQI